MYTPPILNKDAPAYKKLDDLFSNHKAVIFIYRMEKTNVVITPCSVMSSVSSYVCEVFTQKELKEIHPDIYPMLTLVGVGRADCIKDTWQFWKLYKPEQKIRLGETLCYETDVEMIEEPTQFKKRGNTQIIVGVIEYMLKKRAIGGYSFYFARKHHVSQELTAEESNHRYPGLLKTALAGFAIGLSSEQILATWRKVYGKACDCINTAGTLENLSM